jgi:cell division protease FtsH
LIKYETIDSDQIGDIMAGRQARSPADWDDSEPPRGSSIEKEPKSDEKGEGKIGGPAGEH